ncbi:MAG: glycerol-3-phosphate acyltransferase [Firmicutes bacterium]|nr:glycerol-3-phosphate acyltransferase [Bacillota bacterium]
MVSGFELRTALSPLAALAAAFAWGALPLGYALARLLGRVDVRWLSPYNLGLGTVRRRLGPVWPAVLVAPDLVKAALAVWAAARLAGPPAAEWAALGAVAGHLYSPGFLWPDGWPPRSRGTAAAAGAWLGLGLAGVAAPGRLLLPFAAAAAVLLLPRALGGRWGWPSLAAAAGAASMPAVLAGRAAEPLPVLVLAALLLWRQKEHLARIVDGVEPRLGERRPLPETDADEVACAFLIHPMTPEDWWQSRRFGWLATLARRRLLPQGLLERLALRMRPMQVDEIAGVVTRGGRRARVYLLGVPMLPGQIKRHERVAVLRARQAARLARELGASVLGLGAYWSVVGEKGSAVQAESPLPVTNGGAYTAGAVAEAVPRIMARLRARGLEPGRVTAAVVGANGVVGFGIARAIAGQVGRLLMLGTRAERLERSASTIRRHFPGLEVTASTDLGLLREADVIFTATSQVEPVVLPEHVRPGTLLYDVGRPADVHPAVARIPGVEVVPGGVVALPGEARFRLELGYGPGLVPACLAETLLIALDGAFDRCTLGGPARAENVRYFVERARSLGFRVVTEAPAGGPAARGVAS